MAGPMFNLTSMEEKKMDCTGGKAEEITGGHFSLAAPFIRDVCAKI